MGRLAPARASDLAPSSGLPLAYYSVAHAGLASALAVLVWDPSLPGASFYHPRLVALVHLVTLAWITGSILGSLYIVGPLALRIPMIVRRTDWLAFASFVAGVLGMVSHFWIGTYDGMVWSASLVMVPLVRACGLVVRGMPGASAPPAVLLHVGLAFINIFAAATLGILIGLNRSRGFMALSPIGVMFAHAHLAAIGWVAMLVIGLSYRLIPMMLPAAMPTGRSLALSAVFLESGLAVIVVGLLAGSQWLFAGALLITAGFASFVLHLRRALQHGLPRPPALPRRDWSTWQTHAAFLWLLVAVGLGVALTTTVGGDSRLTMMWVYGVAGLVGFLAQIVAGIEGRLVPFYAWYRAFAKTGGPPDRAANALPSAPFARAIFACWTAGVPLLACGLSLQIEFVISLAATTLLTAVVIGAAYLRWMVFRCPLHRAS